MVVKLDQGVWTLTSDTSGTAWRHSGGLIHYSVLVSSGTGALAMQISYDQGTTWTAITDASHTATVQKNMTGIPPGVLIRPNLSGSASTPIFIVKAYSVDQLQG